MKRTALILVPANGKYLIGQRRDNDKWNFPAGHLNDKEDPKAGALRELKEETGLSGFALHLVGAKMIKPGHMHYTFLARAVGPLTHRHDPDEEFKNLQFMSKADIDKIPDTDFHVPRSRNSALCAIERHSKGEI